jgi:thioredoxin reductase (NADPH)
LGAGIPASAVIHAGATVIQPASAVIHTAATDLQEHAGMEGGSDVASGFPVIQHDLYSVAYPTLEPPQMAELARCAGAAIERYRAGQTLIRAGERDFKFFVVKSGEVEIQDPGSDPPRTVVVHGPGQFTGDVAHLTGNASIVSAVARRSSEVYGVSPDVLKDVLNRCPVLSDVILQAFIARRQLLRESGSFIGLRVIGSRYSQDTSRIRDFLATNRVPFTWLDLEADPQVRGILERFGLREADTPVVAWGRTLLLRNPGNRQLAEVLGLRQPIEEALYDLVIVGAGPAGLAAAVYGASEGLRTVVLERTAPGGQAGKSMRIENYLGFPTGITGSELTDRAVIQADKFGARLFICTGAVGLTFEQGYPILHIEGGESVATRCLLIATGVDYRRLDVEGCAKFEGCGVYYAATPNEAQMCRGSDVVVVGGGNSAGQAAVFLSEQARKVFLVVRGDDLYKDMSSYLARRILETPHIEVLLGTTVRRMSGDEHLAAVEVVDDETGQARTIEAPALFSFIGAVPRTDWLPSEIERDAKGFIRTGPREARPPSWTRRRAPFLLETSHPAVFAAGDVRSGSIKRVASAVGEGSMTVHFVHECLKDT